MNTGQTAYEQLQEILNKCIELGWRKGVMHKSKITSVKPMGRPLYQYKVGDKVVVLDNYPAKDFIGKVGIIETVGVGLVAVDFKESNSLGAMLDIRCIAPVLD